MPNLHSLPIKVSNQLLPFGLKNIIPVTIFLKKEIPTVLIILVSQPEFKFGLTQHKLQRIKKLHSLTKNSKNLVQNYKPSESIMALWAFFTL